MAGTYKLIGAVTVGAGGAASMEFTSIPSTYTDLLIKVTGRTNKNDLYNDLSIRFNGSSSNFTTLGLVASSSSNSSFTTTSPYVGSVNDTGGSGGSNLFSSNDIYISNYASSNFKCVLADSAVERNDNGGNELGFYTTLWSQTAAITTITLVSNGYTLAQYSTAYLYGIEIPAQQITPKATGGDITFNDTHVFHTFRQSGTFTPLQSLTADYLVVAGGGGSGAKRGGGGGAGGLRSTVTATGGGGSLESALSLTAQAYTVTVGGGGAAGSSDYNNGTQGSNSVFSTITSDGGGFGSTQSNGGANASNGGNGGSGGGGGGSSAAGQVGGTATASPVQGFNGGKNAAASANEGGGGGGAGAVGANGLNGTETGAAGGVGVAISAFATPTLTGVSSYYAGGGGGGGQSTGGAGGAGGGGAGNASTTGNAGTTNTGGGGGASGPSATLGGAGGSGIVIVRYLK